MGIHFCLFPSRIQSKKLNKLKLNRVKIKKIIAVFLSLMVPQLPEKKKKIRSGLAKAFSKEQ